jgi:hypothetical protein
MRKLDELRLDVKGYGMSSRESKYESIRRGWKTSEVKNILADVEERHSFLSFATQRGQRICGQSLVQSSVKYVLSPTFSDKRVL